MTDTIRQELPLIRFQIPEDFVALPLDTEPQEREQRVHALVETRFGWLPADRRPTLEALYRLVAEGLARSGTRYAGVCFGRVPGEERLTSASLVVNAAPMEVSDPRVAAEGTAEVFARQYGQAADVHRIDLPCGPATVVILLVEVRPEAGEAEPDAGNGTGNAAGNEAGNAVVLGQLQAYVPMPAHGVMLVVSFSTPDLESWDGYMPMVVDLLRSLRVDEGE